MAILTLYILQQNIVCSENWLLLTPGNTDGNDGKTIFSVCPRLKAFSDWLLKVMVSGNLEVIFPAATREYAPLVEELWNNSAIKATYNRRSELELLPSVASYFLERVRSCLVLLRLFSLFFFVLMLSQILCSFLFIFPSFLILLTWKKHAWSMIHLSSLGTCRPRI